MSLLTTRWEWCLHEICKQFIQVKKRHVMKHMPFSGQFYLKMITANENFYWVIWLCECNSLLTSAILKICRASHTAIKGTPLENKHFVCLLVHFWALMWSEVEKMVELRSSLVCFELSSSNCYPHLRCLYASLSSIMFSNNKLCPSLWSYQSICIPVCLIFCLTPSCLLWKYQPVKQIDFWASARQTPE